MMKKEPRIEFYFLPNLFSSYVVEKFVYPFQQACCEQQKQYLKDNPQLQGDSTHPEYNFVFDHQRYNAVYNEHYSSVYREVVDICNEYVASRMSLFELFSHLASFINSSYKPPKKLKPHSLIDLLIYFTVYYQYGRKQYTEDALRSLTKLKLNLAA